MIPKLCTLREAKQLQGVRALVYIDESEASEPLGLDLMSLPFNIFIKVITHGNLYKTRFIVVANLTVRPQEINWVKLTFGVIKINPQFGRYFSSLGHHHPEAA